MTIKYVNLSHPFEINEANYERQYAGLYFARLKQLRTRLVAAATSQWASTAEICPRIKDLGETHETDTVVIGTIFKSMKLKPTIIAEYMRELSTDRLGKCISSDDTLFLEDETSRVRLRVDENSGGLNGSALVTGMVVAVRGHRQGLDFVISDLLQVQSPLPAIPSSASGYIALISGLSLLRKAEAQKLDTVRSFLLGLTPGSESYDVHRLIISGACASQTQNTADDIEALDLLDRFCEDICSKVSVDLMPGQGDPTGASLPQAPLNAFFFPRSKNYTKFNLVTNPYFFSIYGVRVMGCSGQTVEDFLRYSSIEKPVAALKEVVKSSQLAPTAPDTLACYPFDFPDPFCLPDEEEKAPHVLFSANHDRFDFDYFPDPSNPAKKVLLLCVPNFSNDPQLVLVSLKTLEVIPINISCS